MSRCSAGKGVVTSIMKGKGGGKAKEQDVGWSPTGRNSCFGFLDEIRNPKEARMFEI